MITRARILVPVALLTAGCLFAQNVKIVNANSGEVLAIAGPNTSNGAQINQTDWSAWSNQQWQILPLGNGYSRIVSPYDSKVLDVTGVSTANGAVIQQYDWLGWANQQWQVVPQGSSYNSIVNLNSGKVLDVQGASTTQGALVQQWDWLNGLNQQWEVVPVQDTYQITAMTSVYYRSPYVFAVGTTDADYSTQYYYGMSLALSYLITGRWLEHPNGVYNMAKGDGAQPTLTRPRFQVTITKALPGSSWQWDTRNSKSWLIAERTAINGTIPSTTALSRPTPRGLTIRFHP